MKLDHSPALAQINLRHQTSVVGNQNGSQHVNSHYSSSSTTDHSNDIFISQMEKLYKEHVEKTRQLRYSKLTQNCFSSCPKENMNKKKCSSTSSNKLKSFKNGCGQKMQLTPVSKCKNNIFQEISFNNASTEIQSFKNSERKKISCKKSTTSDCSQFNLINPKFDTFSSNFNNDFNFFDNFFESEFNKNSYEDSFSALSLTDSLNEKMTLDDYYQNEEEHIFLCDGLNLEEEAAFSIKRILVTFENNLHIIENFKISKKNSKNSLLELKNEIISEILNKFQSGDLHSFQSYFVGFNHHLPLSDFVDDVLWLKITSDEIVELDPELKFLIKIPVKKIQKIKSKVFSTIKFDKLEVCMDPKSTVKDLLETIGEEYPQIDLSCYSLKQADMSKESTGFWDVIGMIVPEHINKIKSRNLKVCSKSKNSNCKSEFELASCQMKPKTFSSFNRILTENFPFKSDSQSILLNNNHLINLKSTVLYLIPEEPRLYSIKQHINLKNMMVDLYDSDKNEFVQSSFSISKDHFIFRKKTWVFTSVIYKIPISHIKSITQTSYSFTIKLK